MNINVLEKLARQVLSGDSAIESSSEMLRNGSITPAEHRSLKGLSWQIAANVKAKNSVAPSPGTTAIMFDDAINRNWC